MKKDKNNSKKKKNTLNKKVSKKLIVIAIVSQLILLASIYFVISMQHKEDKPEEIPFTEFAEMLEAGQVESVEIGVGYLDTFTFKDADGKVYETQNPKSLNFKRELLDYGVEVTELHESSLLGLILTIMEFALMFGFLFFMMKRLIPNTESADPVKETPSVTFDDVAGAKELKSDLSFVIDYMKHPEAYKKLGARLPKGIILYGPPGTGKTLTAKAIAGTAGVPFFSASGSDFVEMYVGLGAKRVRSLFKKAREASPCIVFIDEIDAVGGSRNSASSHSELNQTINALLNELDGFNGSEGILVVAATNRLEDLDPALVRPGRFDKQLAVPLPERDDRKEILKVHSKNKIFSSDVNWDEIAETTVGFSGASIEALLNEAAFIAASNKRDEITGADIDRAMYKLLMKGDQKSSSNKRDKEELRICAYHEAGHVVATKLLTKDRVPKVTIISSTSGAGGVTFRTPKEMSLHSKKYLENIVKIMYAGRAAEEIYFGNKDNITTGASSDIKNATEIIKEYIGTYGMSDEYGLINLQSFQNVSQENLIAKSSEMAKRLYSEVLDLLKDNSFVLAKLANELLKKESLCESEIEEMFAGTSAIQIKTPDVQDENVDHRTFDKE